MPERHRGVDRREVVRRLDALAQPSPSGGLVADRGQHVRAEGTLGTETAAELAEHLGERLGHGVLGLGRCAEAPGEAQGHGPVPTEQLGIGVVVAVPREGQQVRVVQLYAGRARRHARFIDGHLNFPLDRSPPSTVVTVSGRDCPRS